ncbi:bifunctional 3-(3-hydroxy-phenyl)propionate/3-hydroxycinnamic acid hydroxylase [Amycolatopsis pithecellobii]|nr:bifunctional 3-(3-hydroxy-phenyl)propionate/3-hydroxycinnamic acid hydroxylase [Amycolatopsis pithecellobii]
MTDTEQEMADVAVVGAGPVGLSMAALLARHGLTVVLLDRGRHGVVKPRATHLDDEAVRIMQAMGLTGELEPTFYTPSSFTLYDSTRTPVANSTLGREIGDQAWRRDYMFHQPTFESRMREILGAAPLVRARYGVEVTGVTQDADHAEVTAYDIDSGSTFTVPARYVVGCDGAHSAVARSMGVETEDLHATQRWLVVDLLINEDVGDVDDELHTVAVAPPERTYTFVPTGEHRRRIEFKAFDHESDESLETPETVWRLVERWVTPETAVVERADAYIFAATLATRWRDRRLFLAGDAAHQMPPKAGQGLCSGLRDVANLSWKLAFCLQGRAADTVLDTYYAERAPHTRTWTLISSGIARAIEDLAAGRRPDIEGEQRPDSRPPLGSGLHGTTPPPAGTLSLQPFLTDGTRLDDHLGLSFSVIARADVLAACDERTRATWRELGAVVLDATAARYEEWLTEHDAGAVIIRPDKYVHGTARTATGLAALTAQLDVALGANTTSTTRKEVTA